jgi:hypothetical protein
MQPLQLALLLTAAAAVLIESIESSTQLTSADLPLSKLPRLVI